MQFPGSLGLLDITGGMFIKYACVAEWEWMSEIESIYPMAIVDSYEVMSILS